MAKNIILKTIFLFLWPFLPEESFKKNRIKISLISTFFTTFFLFVSVYYFPGGAHHFTIYSQLIVKGGVYPDLATRDIGYPLLLVLSGFPFTNSFVVSTLFHALFSFLIPLLIHGLIGQLYHKTAFFTAILSMLSLIPYIFIKMIHHDQTYLFLSILTIYLAVEFISASNYKFLYLTTLSLIFLTLTKPGGNLIFLPILGYLFLRKRDKKIHYIACMLILGSTLCLYSFHRTAILGKTSTGNINSYMGRQIFYNFYINSKDFNVKIDKTTGTATKQLIEKVEAFLNKNPLDSEALDFWYNAHGFPQNAREYLFKRFKGCNFVERLFSSPCHDYFEFLCFVELNDDVFFKSAIEVFKKHPLLPIRYTFKNLRYFYWEPGYTHSRFILSEQTFFQEPLAYQAFYGAVYAPRELVPDPGYKELIKTPFVLNEKYKPQITFFEYYYWKREYYLVNRILIILAMFGLLYSIRKPGYAKTVVILSILFSFYNAVITSAFAEPLFRYHWHVILFHIIAAGFGLRAIFLLGLKHFVIIKTMSEKLQNTIGTYAIKTNYRYIKISASFLGIFSIFSWIVYMRI